MIQRGYTVHHAAIHCLVLGTGSSLHATEITSIYLFLYEMRVFVELQTLFAQGKISIYFTGSESIVHLL